MKGAVWQRFQSHEVVLMARNIPCIMQNPLEVIDGDAVILSEKVIWLKSMWTRTIEIALGDILSMRVLRRPHSEMVNDVFFWTLEISFRSKNPDARMELIFKEKQKAVLWATEIQKHVPEKRTVFLGTSGRKSLAMQLL